MIPRRQFLHLASAGAVLAAGGCSAAEPDGSGQQTAPPESGPGGPAVGASAAPAPAGPVRPRPVVVPAAAAVRAFAASGVLAGPGEAGPFTIAGLLAAPEFFVAHRGSGDNWTEHTMRAYREAVASGLKAIEVSVSATRDGVLVCHHDLNTQRLTGTGLQIPRVDYAELEPLRNNARAWLGPATPLEPLPRLRDVLDAFAASHVIFLEDKPGTNTEQVLALLEAYPRARDHVIWKQPAASAGHAAAAARGYTTFGYLTAADEHRVAGLIPRADILGVHHTAPAGMIRRLVEAGKPVAAWEVHRRSEHAMLRELGVRGFICSNIRYVLHLDEPATADAFATGRRASGDLPWIADAVWEEQPDFVGEALRFHTPVRSGYVLGSMAEAVDAAAWECELQMRWPDRALTPGRPDQAAGPDGAGVAFGLASDSPDRPGVPGTGYQVIIGADGTMTLARRDGRDGKPVKLAGTAGPAPAPGRWITIRIAVGPHRIRVDRLDGSAGRWTVAAADTTYGGAWLALLKDYEDGPPVEFRRLRLRAGTDGAGAGGEGNVG